ncbi:LysR family transcriptional regulator [Alkalihalobacillus sp. MEB130]|uniref:LysR family transcriptional regulator n=1 Tax=Alkalihalobacillus sp. MEB130 TaxID=2976704 RepID=UPI0028E073A0|nr:LysR family transcriptional regulator [Alkalihalobacillus sp. MEB130]MDT8861887.1 LysR family transcriptional regulator [Alkalihalobacillus sp. MEB130]
MDIKHIEAFIQVANTGSFSKAAEYLYLTQPSISARIKTLENEIGYHLFERSNKAIVLNQAGRTFLPFAEEVIRNYQEGKLSVHSTRNSVSGEIEFATVNIASNYLLPQITQKFYKQYPKIKLGIHTTSSPKVLDMILTHEVPFGIARSVTHPKVENIPLIEDELVVAVYPGHPFCSLKKVSLAKIASEPLISFNRGTVDWSLIQSSFQKQGLEPNIVLEIDNIEAMKQMVKQKLGITLLSRFTLEEEVRNETLYTIDIQESIHVGRNLDLLFLKGKQPDGLSQMYLTYLLNHFHKSEPKEFKFVKAQK